MNVRSLLYVFCFLLLLGVAACHTNTSMRATRKLHQGEAYRPGGLLYVDNIDYKKVVSSENGESGKRFIAYKAGFYDSTLLTDKVKKEAVALYYQYKMSNDWKILLDGDSLAPVFFHPVTSLNSHVNEGILVFELPADKQADTLVYTDATGAWDTQIFTIKATK